MTADTFALVSAGVFLLVGMLTGWWKYRHMMRASNAAAPVYVNICHRSALMYAFACIVLQQLALRSRWSEAVDMAAVVLPIVFFASAVASYAIHGWLRDTNNQLRRPHQLGQRTLPGALIHTYMILLGVGEIGGVVVLLAGVV